MAGKVIVIGGNKRAGKSMLGRKLQTEAGFNYYNLDHITNSVDYAWFKDGLELNAYFPFIESLIDYAITDAKRENINSVFDFIYGPDIFNRLKNKNDVEFIYLANLDLNKENIIDVLMKYSKDYEYSANKEDVIRNIPRILERNESLIEECKRNNVKLINTSFGKDRDIIINRLYQELTGANNAKDNKIK